MMVNADCTLYRYENGGFVRYVIPKVYWRESKAANVMRSGLASADSTTVYLYDDAVVPTSPSKDMLVKGDFKLDRDYIEARSLATVAYIVLTEAVEIAFESVPLDYVDYEHGF